MKTFANTQLAETFEEPGQQIKEVSWLMDRCEQFDGDLPEGVGIITAGIDTQNNRLEAEVVGWGIGEESWSMLYKIIPGDPAQPETWKELDKLIQTPFHRADGGVSFIVTKAIDSYIDKQQQTTSFTFSSSNSRKPRADKIEKLRQISMELKQLTTFPNINPFTIMHIIKDVLDPCDKRTLNSYLKIIKKDSKENTTSSGKGSEFDVTKFVEKIQRDNW